MDDVGVSVFVKWARHQGLTDPRVRAYLTIMALVCDHDALVRLRNELPLAQLDEVLLEDVLSNAEPQEVVEILTQRVGRDISPALFKRTFDRTIAMAGGIDVVSRLMFVAGLFLDVNNGAFQLPRGVVDQLLISEDLDHRLAGIKCLRHTAVTTETMLTMILRTLSQDDSQEKFAAMSQLGTLLIAKSAIPSEMSGYPLWGEVQSALTTLQRTDKDESVREFASHVGTLWRNVSRDVEDV